MKRFLILLVIVAAPAQAFEWPWQHQQRESYSYCKGFVSAGLGAFPVQDLSRIQLWLSWNNVVDTQFKQGGVSQDQYDAGKARFDSLLAASDVDSLVRLAGTECNYGES